MKVRPLRSYVIIERDTAPERSVGGVLLPVAEKDVAYTATVISTGPGELSPDGKKWVTTGVKPGDRIAYNRDHVKDFKVDGETVSMVIGGGILGILPKKKIDISK
jgi:chaperonin GroES